MSNQLLITYNKNSYNIPDEIVSKSKFFSRLKDCDEKSINLELYEDTLKSILDNTIPIMVENCVSEKEKQLKELEKYIIEQKEKINFENNKKLENIKISLKYFDCYDKKYLRKEKLKRIENFFANNLSWDDDIIYSFKFPISEEFYLKYIDNVAQTNIDNLSEKFMEANPRLMNLSCPNLSEDFLHKYIEKNKISVNWHDISRNKGLSEKFFEQYIPYLISSEILWNENISEAFLEKYPQFINEHYIYEKNFSEEFWEKKLKNNEKISWYYLCLNQKLSEKFIEKYLEKISWTYLGGNHDISETLIEKYFHLIYSVENNNFYSLCKNTSLSEAFFEKLINISPERISWMDLCENTGLSEAFFERLIENNEIAELINWSTLSKNNNLTEEFFERHLPRIDWFNISRNSNISIDFFEKHIKKISVPNLTRNSFEKYLERVCG